MTPPTVLLDASFLHALRDVGDAHHATAASSYASLVDAAGRGEVRLRARADHLAAADRLAGAALRRSLLAPVEPVHVAAQHRRQAERLRLPPGEAAPDPDVAVTLVVLRRERIRTVASFHPAFARFDVEVLPRLDDAVAS